MSHASVLVAVDCEQHRIHSAVSEQMKPFDEAGDWLADGSRWDHWTIGGRDRGMLGGEDVILRSQVDLERLRAHRREEFVNLYKRAASDGGNAEHKEIIYGVKRDEPVEDFVSRLLGDYSFPAFFAFLRNREWHEAGRLGWFGATTSTECQRESRRTVGEEFSGKCIHESATFGAKIVSWQEYDEGSDKWDNRFFDRFVRRLPAETWLVAVDYHV